MAALTGSDLWRRNRPVVVRCERHSGLVSGHVAASSAVTHMMNDF